MLVEHPVPTLLSKESDGMYTYESGYKVISIHIDDLIRHLLSSIEIYKGTEKEAPFEQASQTTDVPWMHETASRLTHVRSPPTWPSRSLALSLSHAGLITSASSLSTPYQKSKAGTANQRDASPAALLLDLWRQR